MSISNRGVTSHYNNALCDKIAEKSCVEQVDDYVKKFHHCLWFSSSVFDFDKKTLISQKIVKMNNINIEM